METEASRHRVTVVDDDEDILALMRDIIAGMGHDPTTLDGRDLTIETVAATRPDLLILDLRLPLGQDQLTGVELLKLLRRHRAMRRVPVILCSADAQGLAAASSEHDLDGMHVLTKPFDLDTLEARIREAIAGSSP
jgi:CheY-like chemotaxis protein